MPISKYAIETFISKKITEVNECNVADLYAEFPSAKKWLSGFGLMVIFTNQPPYENRPFALQFLRRVEAAFSEYALAREELQRLISEGNGGWSPYYRALYHFEAALGQLYQAYDYSRKKLGLEEFKSGDGSPLDRLNKIHDTSKHQLANEDQPVWITNNGIETDVAIKSKKDTKTNKKEITFREIKITFKEVEALMRKYGEIAMALSDSTIAQGFIQK